jgi:arsenate reductase (thioredoxin)
MAEAFFNRMAKGKAMVLSAGTVPAEKINPVVIEAMREVGIDISNNKTKALTIDMVKQADRMVTMGCGAETEGVCPASFIQTEDWALQDPQGKPMEEVRRIRDQIEEKVLRLTEELISKKPRL